MSPDVWGPVPNGRLGDPFRKLAFQLADAGHDVTLLYTSPTRHQEDLSDWVAYYKEHEVKLVSLPEPEVRAAAGVVSQGGQSSYAVLEWLRANEPFDVVHAPEMGGDLYHSLWAKRSALALQGTTFVVSTHGGHWWSAEGNFRVFDEISSLLRAQQELRCIELADVVVSPSQYMLNWLESHEVVLPDRTFVWPNPLDETENQRSPSGGRSVRGVAYVGELDARAGVHHFLHALRRFGRKQLRELPIWFLGDRSPLFDFDAALQALQDERRGLMINVRTGLNNEEIGSLLLTEELLTVSPALEEDASLVVSTCISGGIPLVATDVGGVRELLDPSSHEILCRPMPYDIAVAIEQALENGGTVPVAAHDADVTNSVWRDWHAAQPEGRPFVRAAEESRDHQPEVGDVTVCVVHHDQADILPLALDALARQTMRPTRIIVVDNGSRSKEAKALLRELSELGEIDGVELTILRGPNRYPGAARNRAARRVTTEYLVFADDDNLAKPNMIESFVRACESDPETAAFTCFADYFHESDKAVPPSVLQRGVFFGGLGMLGAVENSHGDMNSIVRRSQFEAVGGFHDVWGVGREDHDLFLRLSVGGYGVGVVPEALFYYRKKESRLHNLHVSREAGPSLVAMSGAAALDRDVRMLVEGARGFHDRIGFLEKSVRSLETDLQSSRGQLNVVRGNLRSLQKRFYAEHRGLEATERRLEEAGSVLSDLRWLLRRLEGTPARYVLRRFEGYRTLLRRYL